MRVSLELLRIIILLVLLGGLGWMLIENAYTINETTESFSWLGGIGILILFFILYRNKLQFYGWFKGKNKKKLPKNVWITLITFSVILIITPFVLGNY